MLIFIRKYLNNEPKTINTLIISVSANYRANVWHLNPIITQTITNQFPDFKISPKRSSFCAYCSKLKITKCRKRRFLFTWEDPPAHRLHCWPGPRVLALVPARTASGNHRRSRRRGRRRLAPACAFGHSPTAPPLHPASRAPDRLPPPLSPTI